MPELSEELQSSIERVADKFAGTLYYAYEIQKEEAKGSSIWPWRAIKIKLLRKCLEIEKAKWDIPS